MATDSKFLTLVNGICTQVSSISAFTGTANEIISTDSNVTAESNAAEPDATTWDLEIEINGGAGIVLASVPGTGDQVEASISQNLNAGDRVSIWLRNQSAAVNRPAAIVYGRRRV